MDGYSEECPGPLSIRLQISLVPALKLLVSYEFRLNWKQSFPDALNGLLVSVLYDGVHIEKRVSLLLLLSNIKIYRVFLIILKVL